MELEKYQRATPNELDSILLRIGMVKNQPSLFPEIYDNEGNIISADQLSKANELSGAGVEYITSVCEYAYTHFLDKIKRQNKTSPLYDTLPPLDWAAYLEIASGGISGQVERIERTVMQYQAKPKTALMIDNKGNLHSRWPFVLDFSWEGPGNLDSKTAARFARLNKLTNAPKKDKDTGTIFPRLPIQRVTIMAAKPLFETFYKKDPSLYSFPTGMYAKMFDIANGLKKDLIKEMPYSGISNLDTDISISAYTRFARYIMRHNNLTANNVKDKNYCGHIKLPVYDFLGSVYPSLIHINGRGERSIDRGDFSSFIINAEAIYLSIPDFKIYPVCVGIENEKLEFALYTDPKKALKAMNAVVETRNSSGKYFNV